MNTSQLGVECHRGEQAARWNKFKTSGTHMRLARTD
jgi:hypothetical protein